MAETPDLVLKNGRIVTPNGIHDGDIAIKGGKIAGIGRFDTAHHVIDCKNLHILPGIIDTHVHFREPGLTHKEDISTGTLSAIAGGVTTIFEMPNTNPLTITAATMKDKMTRAQSRAFCDYGFYMGGCADNAAYLSDYERLKGVAGIKVFMGSSTGSLLCDNDGDLLKIFQNAKRLIALHAEDETRLTERKPLAKNVSDHPVWRDAECALLAVKRAVSIARKTKRHAHFLHVTSADEMAFLKDNKDAATIETTPQHLTLSSEECYDRLGTRAQMNPPIRSKEHQDALWRGIADGTVDTLGSDHAPHTIEEKSRSYPQSPSGMPGVQTILAVMLNHVANQKLSLEKLVDLLCHNPARIYGIAGKGKIDIGYDADFAIVDLDKNWTITDQWIQSKCGWTPFDNMHITGKAVGTILRGLPVMWDDEILSKNPLGKPADFLGFTPLEHAADPENIAAPMHVCCQ